MSQLNFFDLLRSKTRTLDVPNQQAPTPKSRQGEFLFFDDRPVEIVRRPYQRTINVSVRPNGLTRVTCGRSASQRSILKFLSECRRWIQQAHNEYRQLRERYPAKMYKHGERFLYLGEWRSLHFAPSSHHKWRFEVRGPQLKASVPMRIWNDDWFRQSRPELKPLLLKFYEKQGRELLASRVSVFSERMQLYPSALSFRSQKTRWGSCSSRGRISLNWRLIAAPIAALDYVVIHELAHLKQPNHSLRFWNLVERFSPAFEDHRKWLRENQYEFDFLARQSELHP